MGVNLVQRLTVKRLESLNAGDDGVRIRGEHGIVGHVRFSASAGVSVSFYWRYRTAGKIRETLVGTWPKLTLAQINVERLRLGSLLAQGRDPADEKRLAKVAARTAQRDELAAEAVRAARLTVSQLFDQWHELELAKRKTADETVRRFKKDVLPTLANMAVEEVCKSHIMAILDGAARRGAIRLPKMLLSDIRQMFRFAVMRDYVEGDPSAGIAKSRLGKDVERDRVLCDAEVRDLAKRVPVHAVLALKHSELPVCVATAAAIWIALATACRIGELAHARWADVDLESGEWRLPTTKNSRPHLIYLSPFAKTLFEMLARMRGDSEYVYPGRGGKRPMTASSLGKQLHDRQGTGASALKKRTKDHAALILEGGRWTFHDLRRTAATLMGGDLGVPPHVVDRVLNHVEQNRMQRIYQRQTYAAEQREAWLRLGSRLELLTTNGACNVILMPRAA